MALTGGELSTAELTCRAAEQPQTGTRPRPPLSYARHCTDTHEDQWCRQVTGSGDAWGTDGWSRSCHRQFCFTGFFLFICLVFVALGFESKVLRMPGALSFGTGSFSPKNIFLHGFWVGWGGKHTPGTRVKVRGQLWGVCSLLLPHSFSDSVSGHRVWQLAPVSTLSQGLPW